MSVFAGTIWYKLPSWLAVREAVTFISIIVGVLGFAIAVATFVNALIIRQVDLDSKRFDRTVGFIEEYNEKWREDIKGAVEKFNLLLADEESQLDSGTDDERLELIHLRAANTSGLVEAVHYLNLIGYMLTMNQYIYKDDLRQAIQSQLYRAFSAPKYLATVTSLRNLSSMKYLPKLFEEIGLEQAREDD